MRSIDRLLSIMARLRDRDHGCEWDREQTYETIAPYTIEEAYEVADAIARSDLGDLREELGDLLLQVVFHARIAEEAGHFDFADVASSISDKLETRHPHIFGTDASATSQSQRWEALKQAERSAKGATSALDGVALALPSLMRAEKLQKRAARTGFDWPNEEGPKAKILEELDELADAETEHERVIEAGDLLFSVVNYLRAQGIPPEDALRAANAKFERRFRSMETLSQGDGHDFAALTLDEQERYWQAVKASERGETP
ncbi:ATP diphosphatase [Novosphingobium chloroacetimidivorans]|uniref:ATP diphosphatase n=1 Tax=Novosphingobium chloroacetimidivorans TaxID=1428314 RepID=A0A7W7K5T4_9SPHN|nr:nucleoside triphosphate pyrophosphohydrolase [Novosphingobium chloroacetimidivorans]MBB4856795.1 ATP diphosphatase [Novosphingobium chloroacetimidivorans]